MTEIIQIWFETWVMIIRCKIFVFISVGQKMLFYIYIYSTVLYWKFYLIIQKIM